MDEKLESKIAGWLKEQGYPLEMEVAYLAKSEGFDVSQSDYYIDPENGGAREIDLVISQQKSVMPTEKGKRGFSIDYSLYVECKQSPGKPWVLFSTANDLLVEKDKLDILQQLSIYSSYIASDLAKDFLQRSFFTEGFENIYPRLSTEPVLSYGAAQAFAKGKDAAFTALMSCSKAALASVNNTVFLSTPVSIAIPVIVVDAPLVSVVYVAGSPDLEIEEVKRGILLWKHMVAGRSRFGIYIVQRQEVASFLKDCKQAANWLTNIEGDLLNELNEKRLAR